MSISNDFASKLELKLENDEVFKIYIDYFNEIED